MLTIANSAFGITTRPGQGHQRVDHTDLKPGQPDAFPLAAYPTLDMTPPAWAILAGMGMALLTGILFGIMPARRASALDPVQSLARR